jgi:hypothetical protein
MAVLAISTRPYKLLLTAQHIMCAGPYQEPLVIYRDEARAGLNLVSALECAHTPLLEMIHSSSPVGLSDTVFRRFGSASLSVIVDTAWARVFVCRWDPSLSTVEDFLKYAMIEFERRFHLDAIHWHLEPDQVRPGRDSLFCAFEKSTIELIGRFAKLAKLRLTSLLPLFLAELSPVLSANARQTSIYIDSGLKAKMIAWIEAGRLRDLLLCPVLPSDLGDTLAVFKSRLGIEAESRIKVIQSMVSRNEFFATLLAGTTPPTKSRHFDDFVAEAG